MLRAEKPNVESLTYDFLVQFLLFRLMFSSGVVKLLSQGSEWWNCTALKYHYFTTCIPHWGSFLAFHLPVFTQLASCAIMFFIEIVLPFAIFVPTLLFGRLNSFAQILLQMMIMLTGNYNFFNLLTCALALPSPSIDSSNFVGKRHIARLVNFVALAALVVGGVLFYQDFQHWWTNRHILSLLPTTLRYSVYAALAFGIIYALIDAWRTFFDTSHRWFIRVRRKEKSYSTMCDD